MLYLFGKIKNNGLDKKRNYRVAIAYGPEKDRLAEIDEIFANSGNSSFAFAFHLNKKHEQRKTSNDIQHVSKDTSIWIIIYVRNTPFINHLVKVIRVNVNVIVNDQKSLKKYILNSRKLHFIQIFCQE